MKSYRIWVEARSPSGAWLDVVFARCAVCVLPLLLFVSCQEKRKTPPTQSGDAPQEVLELNLDAIRSHIRAASEGEKEQRLIITAPTVESERRRQLTESEPEESARIKKLLDQAKTERLARQRARVEELVQIFVGLQKPRVGTPLMRDFLKTLQQEGVDRAVATVDLGATDALAKAQEMRESALPSDDHPQVQNGKWRDELLPLLLAARLKNITDFTAFGYSVASKRLLDLTLDPAWFEPWRVYAELRLDESLESFPDTLMTEFSNEPEHSAATNGRSKRDRLLDPRWSVGGNSAMASYSDARQVLIDAITRLKQRFLKANPEHAEARALLNKLEKRKAQLDAILEGPSKG